MADNADGENIRELVNRRQEVYGEPVDCWVRIAQVWSGILGHEVQPAEAVLCMIGMKTVRTAIAPDYSDNNEDIEGYREILKQIVGEDMVHARSVSEYLEKKYGA